MPAVLVARSSGKVVRLLARSLVGRSPECQLRLETECVSTPHASLIWTNQAQWELRDLGSLNGTFVNESRLSSGERRILSRGDLLAFGDPSESWLVQDVSGPIACARNLAQNEIVWADKQLLSIPSSPGEPCVQVYEDQDGNWVSEGLQDVRAVKDGDVLQLAGELWMLALPVSSATTVERPDLKATLKPLGGASLRIFVSADQDYIRASLDRKGQELWASDRAYNYVLLGLAEARLADRERNISEAEQGWVYSDDLATHLGFTDSTRINVDVHRLRLDLGEAGIPGAPRIVERRRGTGQLRVGAADIRIERSASQAPSATQRVS